MQDLPTPAAPDPGDLAGSTDVSSGQRRLWFLHQQAPDSLAQHISNSFVATGKLDAVALGSALERIVERHEALRTCFHFDGEHLRCTPAREDGPVLAVFDLRGEAEPGRGELGRTLSRRFFERPFDLSADRMLRAQLIQFGDESFALDFCIHHIAFDGWSTSVFNAELEAEYRTLSNGDPLAPVAPDRSYRAFARWQNELLASPEFAAKLDRWTGTLAGPWKSTPLAIAHRDRPADSAAGLEAGSVGHRLDTALFAEVTARAKALRTTRFIVLLTAFKVLLFRYSGEPDLCVGTASAGRTRIEFERAIGFFVNFLALRSTLDGGETFAQLVRRIHLTALDAYDHSDIPFDRLVAALNPERNGAEHPLFQVMFNYQNKTRGRMSLPDVRLALRPAEVTESELDLTFDCHEVEQTLSIAAIFDQRRFHPDAIRRVLAQYERLLGACLADPQSRIAELAMLPVPEREQLLEWGGARGAPGAAGAAGAAGVAGVAGAVGTAGNGTGPADARQALIARFEQAAAAAPAAIALAEAGREIGFDALQRAARRLADGLRRIGVTAGDRIALRLARGEQAIVSMLAVLEVGALWVPLELEHPVDRHRLIVREAGCRLVIGGDGDDAEDSGDTNDSDDAGDAKDASGPTKARFAAPVRAFRAVLDATAAPLPATVQATPSTLPDGDAIYLMFTSGSTGKPKAVVGSARALLNRLDWMQAHDPLRPADVVCHKTSLAFVDSVAEIFGPLLAGARIAVATTATVRDPEQLLQLMVRNRVTHLTAVPSYLDGWCAQLEAGTARPDSLRMLISSGERLTPPLLARLQRALPGCRLLNLYGSTEITADATWIDLTDCSDDARLSVGTPIAGATVRVLDTNLQLCPIGVRGEVCIGGAVLSGGYLDQPELNRERFVPDPFGAGRLFRTGDLGYVDDSGRLRLDGRLDGQVKIRGHRVQPQEIESACLEIDGVRACCVEVLRDAGDAPTLVLFYAATDGGPAGPSVDEVRRRLRAALPEYMIPAFLRRLAALPVASGGKVDRARLREAFRPDERAAPGTASPGNAGPSRVSEVPDDIELAVLEVWADVLGHRGFGLDAAFFDVGGHSLLGLRLLHRLHRRFGVKLPVTALFEAATPRSMAQLLRAGAGPADSAADGRRGGGGGGDRPPSDGGADGSLFRTVDFGAVRAARTGPPIILFPPNGATAMYFQQLVGELKAERPLLAMRGEMMWDMTSMAAVTDRAVDDLLSVQPQGPYLMIAACLGAHFAYDVARRLTQRNQTVRLFVLDAVGPSTALHRPLEETIPPGWLYRPRMIYRSVFKRGWRYLAYRARVHLKSRRDPEVRWYEALLLRQTKLLGEIRAEPVPVEVVLIESAQLHREGANGPAWRRLALGGFESIVIPRSAHYQINTSRSKYAPQIAAIIRERMGRS